MPTLTAIQKKFLNFQMKKAVSQLVENGVITLETAEKLNELNAQSIERKG